MADEFKINDSLLVGDSVSIKETPNRSGEFASNLPDTIVIHYTGGSSAESSASYLCKPEAKASAHVVIGRDGTIIQLAPFNIVTWHAGRSSWKGRSGLNKYAIGIELDNAGELTFNGEDKYFSWFNRAYSKDEVFYGKHRNRSEASFWHCYSEIQIEKTFALCQLLCEQYNIKEIVGHEEISPKRKSDPGPAFPLERLRDTILGDGRMSEEAEEIDENATVIASKLNFRSGPSVTYPTISDPLTKGTVVKVLEEKDDWAKIEQSITGWVSKQYLK